MRTLIPILFLALAVSPAPAASGETPTAEELLASTIAYHDPEDTWSYKTIEIVADVNMAERLAAERGYAVRTDRVLVDNRARRFQYRTFRRTDRIEVIGDGDNFRAELNHVEDISAEDQEKHGLKPLQLRRIRDYYTYMYGIPMKLRDPGTRVHPDVQRVEFNGREAYALRVTYDAGVGGDTWYFYVDPDTYALVGCRFFHDEAANDGEYIVFSDEVESRHGLRLPKLRLWYTNAANEFLASDEITTVGLAPTLAQLWEPLPIHQRASSATRWDPHRQFDFWIGEWDVNLRMPRPDGNEDTVPARASIYSILNGKAILELWDSDPIKGFSLRHFDESSKKWILWLNWPSSKYSGMSSLEGQFSDGRGDFFTESKDAQGETVTSRYSFYDVTADSLRWADAFSKDGENWRGNWVMEWSRRETEPVFPPLFGAAPTYDDGSRCPDEKFRAFEALAGNWTGANIKANMQVRKILDGCAVMAFVVIDGVYSFWIATWDTRAEQWELSFLQGDRSRPLLRYTSTDDPMLVSTDGGDRMYFMLGDELSWFMGDAIRFQREIRFRRN